MADPVIVRARYRDHDDFMRALEAFSGQAEAFAPVRLDTLGDLMPKRGSTVRFWAYFGALAGMAIAYHMCVASSAVFGLIVGGKPPVSRVPFLVVTYAGTILLGAISVFIAFLIAAGMRPRKPGPETGATEDMFGVEVACKPEDCDSISERLRSLGAHDVRVISRGEDVHSGSV